MAYMGNGELDWIYTLTHPENAGRDNCHIQ